MFITTTEKKINTHLIQVDDTEIERYLKDPDSWLDLLHDLLMAKPSANGDGPPPAKRAKVKSAVAKRRKTSSPGIEMIECPKCGMTVKARGMLIHQRGSKCRARSGIGISTPLD